MSCCGIVSHTSSTRSQAERAVIAGHAFSVRVKRTEAWQERWLVSGVPEPEQYVEAPVQKEKFYTEGSPALKAARLQV